MTWFQKNMVKSNIELLGPAGSWPSLVAAINAGADAVYFGLEDLNMRASAKNFTIKDLADMKERCRKKKVKMYLTLNTIIYDNDLKKVEEIIKQVKDYVDAIICWDISIIQLCKKYRIPFHVSTQASIANIEAAKFYKNLGAERVVLARELSLEQIKRIAKIIDVEVFCHGAMCVSVSGRCFTSQFLFNKSANRGECLQPCRREYIIRDEEGNELKLKNKSVMSAKDLCTLPFIEELKKAGVKSFKIEGRNREPEYVDIVTRVYRKAIDKSLTKKEIDNELEKLKKVYNKGFSSGFYLGLPTSDDFSSFQDSGSKESKQFIGKVEHYFDKKNVAAIRMSASKIKVGDELLFIGNKTGIIRTKIERMEIERKPIKEAIKGQEVGIKIKGVRKGDLVYIVIKK